MSPTGNNPTYVSAVGCGHIPLPMAGDKYRRAHEPQKAKAPSIDWEAIDGAYRARLVAEGHNVAAVVEVKRPEPPKTKRRAPNRRTGRPRQKILADQHQTIIDRYNNGESGVRIGADYKVTEVAIYRILRKHGVGRRGRGNLTGPNHPTTLLRRRIDALGVTTRTIKDWAIETGHVNHLQRGLPSATLIAAYEQAHQ